MLSDSYIGTKIAKGVVAVQRPAILILMSVCTVAFVGLGFYAIYAFGYPVVSGEMAMNENATIWIRIGFAIFVCVPPFLVAWLSTYYAKKALRQIREDGAIYSEESE